MPRHSHTLSLSCSVTLMLSDSHALLLSCSYTLALTLSRCYTLTLSLTTFTAPVPSTARLSACGNTSAPRAAVAPGSLLQGAATQRPHTEVGRCVCVYGWILYVCVLYVSVCVCVYVYMCTCAMCIYVCAAGANRTHHTQHTTHNAQHTTPTHTHAHTAIVTPLLLERIATDDDKVVAESACSALRDLIIVLGPPLIEPRMYTYYTCAQTYTHLHRLLTLESTRTQRYTRAHLPHLHPPTPYPHSYCTYTHPPTPLTPTPAHTHHQTSTVP